jgi:hypothetical protein
MIPAAVFRWAGALLGDRDLYARLTRLALPHTTGHQPADKARTSHQHNPNVPDNVAHA